MLVVVGGHTRNIGKTSVAAGLIRALREHEWIAVKITQYGHAACAHEGDGCGCEAPGEQAYALEEEFEPGRRDSQRFLAAGARRSFWLRTPAGQLGCALPALRKILACGRNSIIESNSVLEFVDPNVYLVVVDFTSEDFKPSSLRHLHRADGLVVIDRGISQPLWRHVASGLWDQKPQFLVRPPRYASAEVADFVRQRI